MIVLYGLLYLTRRGGGDSDLTTRFLLRGRVSSLFLLILLNYKSFIKFKLIAR